jgi:acylphosphatase
MVARHFLVTGRVQGVGFRRFVQKQALALGLSGQVRNLDDGRVEILARAPDNSVMGAFEKLVAKGPMFASVSHLESKNVDATKALIGKMKDFEILEDGEAPWSIDG